MIINKAITLSRNQEFLEDYSNVTIFKSLNKWIDGFLTRYNFYNHYRIIVL